MFDGAACYKSCIIASGFRVEAQLDMNLDVGSIKVHVIWCKYIRRFQFGVTEVCLRCGIVLCERQKVLIADNFYIFYTLDGQFSCLFSLCCRLQFGFFNSFVEFSLFHF